MANTGTYIKFYSRTATYFEFSNFSYHEIEVDGKTYPTNEHYFQAMKYASVNPEYAEIIRKAATPAEAKRLGSDRTFPIIADWDGVKIGVMKSAVKKKFTQHEDLKKLLLETGDAILQEDAPRDTFWGIGKYGKGKNHLGLILMEVRDEIRKGL